MKLVFAIIKYNEIAFFEKKLPNFCGKISAAQKPTAKYCEEIRVVLFSNEKA